jgi:predicted DNA-binding transcriptional regulator AlpA
MREAMTVKQPNIDKDILNVEEAGALFSVSKWTMYKRAKAETVPAHYMGKRLYFVKSELIEFILHT